MLRIPYIIKACIQNDRSLYNKSLYRINFGNSHILGIAKMKVIPFYISPQSTHLEMQSLQFFSVWKTRRWLFKGFKLNNTRQ